MDGLKDRMDAWVAISFLAWLHDGNEDAGLVYRKAGFFQIPPIRNTVVRGGAARANNSTEGMFNAKGGLSVCPRFVNVGSIGQRGDDVYCREDACLIYCTKRCFWVNCFGLKVNSGFGGSNTNIFVGLDAGDFKIYGITGTGFGSRYDRHAFGG